MRLSPHGSASARHAIVIVRPSFSGRTRSATTSIRRSPRRLWKFWSTPGYQVKIPQQSLCCGRPLYDFGMLDQAKATLEQTLSALRSDIEAGTPIIGIEPSCVSVFRDEMTNLLGKNAEAQKLKSQTYLLSEFLINQADYRPPQLKRKAIVHAHCHHKSVLKFDSESELLKRIGLDFHVLDSGCCGMAGSFGFEAEKYDVSVKIGERVLLPAVRAPPQTRSSSQMASVVTSRLKASPDAERSTSLKCYKWRSAKLLQTAMKQKKARRRFTQMFADSRCSQVKDKISRDLTRKDADHS